MESGIGAVRRDGTAILDEDGQDVPSSGTALDVTEPRQAVGGIAIASQPNNGAR